MGEVIIKINLRDVSFSYNDTKLALKNINFNIDGGQIIGLIGQNGSGKSTLAKILNGILRPTTGTVEINNKDYKKNTIAEISKYIHYVFQNPEDQLFLESVYKELTYQVTFFDEKSKNKKISEVLNLIGLKSKADYHPFDLLPTEKIFCSLGVALMTDPEIYIIDEPTCGQDILGLKRLEEIIQLLKVRNKTIILISHNMNFIANIADRVVLLSMGEIAYDGEPRALFGRDVEEFSIEAPISTYIGKRLEFPQIVLNPEEFAEEYGKSILS